MRPNPSHACTDPEVVRELIDANPWGILVSTGEGAPVASHCPILLDGQSEDLAILTHLGRPDDQIHRIGGGETLLIVQGAHGYISPSWYAPGATRAPTWNFSVAHLYGTPEILEQRDNLAVLTRLVAHFERHVEAPLLLDRRYGARLAAGTVGIRLPISRFTCKLKLSQDKDPVTRRQVIERLRSPGPYANAFLADDMQRVLGE